MANCKIELKFEDGALGVSMAGTTMELIAGCVIIVHGLYTSLDNANGGEVAQLMFKSLVESGIPFDDDSFDEVREECENPEELEQKMQTKKAKKQLGQIVEMLMKNSKEDE